MLHTCVIVVKCSNAPSRAYICISFCNELCLCTSCRSPVSLVLPSYDVPLYLFIKNNTIPVNKHNNAINKIPSNGNLKIYLHDSVKHWWKFENSNPWYIFANNGISKCHILPLLPLYLCIIIIHFFIHNIYQLDLAKSNVINYTNHALNDTVIIIMKWGSKGIIDACMQFKKLPCIAQRAF